MDRSSPPSLSIIIPAYNAERTIRRTLTSLALISDPGRVEVIVVNDGSIDRTGDIVRESAAERPEFRWRIIDKPNGGVSSARNAALDVAGGEWLFFLDGDDELGCDPLPLLDAASDATCVMCGVEHRGPGSTVRRTPPPRISAANRADAFTAASPCAVSSLFFRRGHVSHRFDEDIRYTEDWLFWNRNHAIFERAIASPEAIASIIHVHESNATGNYVAWGRDRAIVAGRIRNLFGAELTLKQRNNLVLQERIGRLQQRKWISPTTFFRWPCDPVLYAKLWVYALSALVGFRATAYRPSPPTTDAHA